MWHTFFPQTTLQEISLLVTWCNRFPILLGAMRLFLSPFRRTSLEILMFWHAGLNIRYVRQMFQNHTSQLWHLRDKNIWWVLTTVIQCTPGGLTWNFSSHVCPNVSKMRSYRGPNCPQSKIKSSHLSMFSQMQCNFFLLVPSPMPEQKLNFSAHHKSCQNFCEKITWTQKQQMFAWKINCVWCKNDEKWNKWTLDKACEKKN